MARSLLILRSKGDRELAAKWAMTAPPGTRVEFRETKRSIPQNDRMWAMLTDVSKQVLHMGKRYPPDIWKILFMSALGTELQFIPSLDGNSFVPLGYRSSELSKDEMSELLEFIAAEGTKRGVIFHDIKEEADGEGTPPAPDKEARPNAPTLQQSTRAIRAITKEPVT